MATQPTALSQPLISQPPTVTNMELDDDAVIADQVMATHHPNLNSIPQEVSGEVEKDMLTTPQMRIRKELSYPIIQLSFEVANKCLNNIDFHSATIHLLSMLSTYPWDTKVDIMLAAFSLNMGRLVTKFRLLNQSLIVAPSKEIPENFIVEFNLVNCVRQLNESSSFSPPQPLILATYWFIRSILTCTRHIFCVESKNEIMEESTLIAKSKTILSACYPLIEAKRIEKSYEALLHAFSHSDNNLEVLKLIFNVNDDSERIFEYIKEITYQPFFGRYPFQGLEERSPTPFEFIGLKNKRVLLIIVSDTNLSEVAFLYHHLSKFDIIPWTILIPIIDYPHQVWSDARMPSLVSKGSLRLKLLHPFKRITPQFIRFVKERCVPSFQSGGEPIVISLDSRGRLVHTNALHMILTWRGALAYDMTVGSGNNIISLLQKELTRMTSGVGSVINDIERRKCVLVSHIEKTIDEWRGDINWSIKNSESSYNYSSKNEEMLWDKETWNLKLLGNHKVLSRPSAKNPFYMRASLAYGSSYSDQKMFWDKEKTYKIDTWIAEWTEMKYDVFLCGGNDAKFIQEFATKVKEVNSQIKLDIKFAYIGNNKKAKSLVKNLSGHALWPNTEYLWFWTRLRSAFLSRINYLNKTGRIEDEDKIFLGLQKLLAYEARSTTFGAWVLLSKGEEVVACDFGDKMMRVMNEYQKWKNNIH